MAPITSIDIFTIADQFPLAMHYDSNTDLIWLLYLEEMDVPNQLCQLSFSGKFLCYEFSGTFGTIFDASAYDYQGQMIWWQSNGAGAFPVLLGFNTSSFEVTTPLKMTELCLHMEIAYLNGAAKLLCVEFASNTLVSVDTSSGKATSVTSLPPLHDPVMNAHAVRNNADGSAQYFVQLQGPTTYDWTQIGNLFYKSRCVRVLSIIRDIKYVRQLI
jgi:hypothetical protein